MISSIRNNCIIIEDDIASQRLISGYLSQLGLVHVVEVFSSIREASTYIHLNPVTLVLISTKISDGTLFDFCSTLIYKPFMIVISDNADLAIDALNIGVMDYLLKPFSESRLQMAINKIFCTQNYIPRPAKSDNDSFSVKIEGSSRKFHNDDVILIEAYGNYVKLLLTDGTKELVFEKISNIEERISKSTFVRVQKSFLININAIQKIENDLLYFPLDQIVTIGKFYKKSAMEKLSNLE
jgi:two-component system, LytTR family, response regulator LytT